MIDYFKYWLVKGRMKKPAYLIFFVTNRCNSRCRHCFYWKELNTKEKDLSLDEIFKFSMELKSLRWLTLSGGEPFLRDDIDEICKKFIENTRIKQITIPTNCLLPLIIRDSAEKIAKLSEKVKISINLSLDGLEKTHDFIRGVEGSFKKVEETYLQLIPLTEKYRNLSIRVNTTICNKNVEEIERLGEYVKENFSRIASHNFEIMRGDPKDREFGPPSSKKVEELIPVLEKIWKGYNFFKDSNIKSKLVVSTKKKLFNEYVKIMQTNIQPFDCYAGRFHMVLDSTGNVYFCELLPKIGNIREKNFNEVWNSPEAIILREKIKRKGCSCTHSCFQNQNLIFDFKSSLRIIKDLLKR